MDPDHYISPPLSLQCENCKCNKCVKYYATYEIKQKIIKTAMKKKEEEKARKLAEKKRIEERKDQWHSFFLFFSPHHFHSLFTFYFCFVLFFICFFIRIPTPILPKVSESFFLGFF